ncbi:hypothetical protein [Clostridium sp. DMHC 10]|uniref:hypothetical protein n=1 Tax=Clostridium sp. DMHC 10 TaxID=747377 RepID=UPI000B19E0EB|nr:hypothetical protein [Clostridium sp. DMHC 10]
MSNKIFTKKELEILYKNRYVPPLETEVSARLACVKHAASVRPEPGSNSQFKSLI